MTRPVRCAIAADTVFDGTALHRDCAVIVEGRCILRLVPAGDVPARIATCRLPAGAWLAPGFIDIQVNGGGDVLFTDSPTPEALATIAAAHRPLGTTSLLPTLLSDTPATMRAARRAVAAGMRRDPGILGLHYEGPFLSRARAGVHDPAMLRRPGSGDIDLLAAPRGGVALVTLAPEEVPPGFIARLAASGVRVALGHSVATYEQTRAALAEGLTGFTHLFNAMPPLAGREPGPVAAALEAPNAWFGMIADGVHVAPAMLRLALRGAARAMLVSDAMPPVGGRRSEFMLFGRRIVARDGACVREDGRLAGSCLGMAGAVRNAVCLLGLGLAEALPLATANPAGFLGVDGRLGHLRQGYRADMVALDPGEIRVLATWVAGARVYDSSA